MDYSKKKTVEDIDVAGKKVLVRCDFNVPLDENGNITDTKRIDEAMKTINYLVSHNAKVILCSHLGRPKGEVNMKYSLKPVAAYLSKKLGFDVKMASDVVGDSAKAIAADLKDGEVELLENVRFEKGETKNDPELAKAMASLAEIYVNDAFGTAHRAHASTAGVADYLPAVCGYLIQKEISVMGTALSNPKRPFVAILGGVSKEELKRIIIAYEPVWAIGTGKTATAEQANEVCAQIRKVIAGLYDQEAADGITIQYGGSMNAKNADELVAQPDVDGGLIGGAALKAPDFAAIVKAASK